MEAEGHLVVLAQLEVVLVWAQATVCGRQLCLQARRYLVQLNGPLGQIVPAAACPGATTMLLFPRANKGAENDSSLLENVP